MCAASMAVGATACTSRPVRQALCLQNEALMHELRHRAAEKLPGNLVNALGGQAECICIEVGRPFYDMVPVYQGKDRPNTSPMES